MKSKGKCSLPKPLVLTSAAVTFLKEVIKCNTASLATDGKKMRSSASLTPKPKQGKKVSFWHREALCWLTEEKPEATAK